jgi:hypothetical protein
VYRLLPWDMPLLTQREMGLLVDDVENLAKE